MIMTLFNLVTARIVRQRRVPKRTLRGIPESMLERIGWWKFIVSNFPFAADYQTRGNLCDFSSIMRNNIFFSRFFPPGWKRYENVALPVESINACRGLRTFRNNEVKRRIREDNKF